MKTLCRLVTVILALHAATGLAAYHHLGEEDSGVFLGVYPETAGTKLDHCALCHTGGSYVDSRDRTVTMGSCQWCHYSYGYDGSGDLAATLNGYGAAYLQAGRSAAAVSAIADLDSDGDGYTNAAEIAATRFPGNAADDPGKAPAPFRVYTRAQLEALGRHTQFLLMNTSRSGDYYAEYTGVPMADLLEDAGITAEATGILVYAPDGFATNHPLDPVDAPNLYHVRGTYPEATFHYDETADAANGGWCDYSAPSAVGRSDGSPIVTPDGLEMILAYERDGVALDTGVLTQENRLDGEGPFRVVPPQKTPSVPDQLSTADNQDVIWPYDADADHNAGFSSRSATLIKVEPLPEGTTDVDIYEAGWDYVDRGKILVYGAIDATDSNGNGVLDSEEAADPAADLDEDGTPDYRDTDTASLRHANGAGRVRLHSSAGAFAEVEALDMGDPRMSGVVDPAADYPYGAFRFRVTGLPPGGSATVSLVFPAPVPTRARYYKVDEAGNWGEIPLGSNDGDATVTITLTDGDPATDADGAANGVILDPGTLALPAAQADSGGGGGGCFLRSLR